jgi:hypothetical protein
MMACEAAAASGRSPGISLESVNNEREPVLHPEVREM